MSRSIGLILGALGLIGPAAFAQELCPETLSVQHDQVTGIALLSVSSPCRPYTPVEIMLGPFVISEETSDRGGVQVPLPLVEGVSEVRARFEDSVLGMPLPLIENYPAFVAFDWDTAPGFGFDLVAGLAVFETVAGFVASEDAPRLQIAVFSPDHDLSSVPVKILPKQCGRMAEGRLITSRQPEPQPLRAQLPECDETIRLDLPLGG
ncbi:hypothetical protein [Qingshengfaniella alkalisoli]|uniref:Uncharacterized protein n=1 Tax=Qingshengfaniella alkalisoli TaxID=2599296 RepID=A0A5B8J2V9_9RHOB|nr:hypothetical protein [Qingshengfaniella alkalisoli]QDY71461.1 hypothetical protein FPZ52_17435 [Qingshengfaniella alkalisoli]